MDTSFKPNSECNQEGELILIRPIIGQFQELSGGCKVDELLIKVVGRLVENAPTVVLFVVLFGWNVKRYVINGAKQRWINYNETTLALLDRIVKVLEEGKTK